jgi:gliding motility-associated-like protein
MVQIGCKSNKIEQMKDKLLVKRKFVILFMILSVRAFSQTITPQVINSAGSHRQLGTSEIYITDNIGEPMVQTAFAGNLMITQGFIQPEIISPGGFKYSPIYQSPNCLESYDDAFIAISVHAPTGLKGAYKAMYLWSPSEICPNNDCAKVDSLKPGLYSVKVVVSYTTNIGTPANDTIASNLFDIKKAEKPCKVVVYSGVSPNDDGINDVWAIDNISDFPKNRVTIYDRWGTQVVDIKGYNNKDKVWPTKEMVNKLISTTYFYIIDLGDGSGPLRGWVELMKNE